MAYSSSVSACASAAWRNISGSSQGTASAAERQTRHWCATETTRRGASSSAATAAAGAEGCRARRCALAAAAVEKPRSPHRSHSYEHLFGNILFLCHYFCMWKYCYLFATFMVTSENSGFGFALFSSSIRRRKSEKESEWTELA